ncbi:MAG: hypothetical protein PUK54_07735 [Firmicutes bacterium]|nr:hypothetical protein [Bacillota bacterium]
MHILKPVNSGGHSAYQNLVLTQLRKYYPDADSSFDASTWDIIEHFWSLDLSPVDQILQDRYSNFGPPPRLPSDMLRSYLLSMKFKVPSLTAWASCLKQNHLYAILSGFLVGDTPGTGTFYDFLDRLWLSDENNLSDPIHPPREKPVRPKKKGEKASPVEKVTVRDLLARLEIEPPQDFAPAGRLFDIFKSLFLNVSAEQNLIDLSSLAISGDGTPVYTGTTERKTCTCDCLAHGIRDCKCNRIFHQPDCNIGWDSHRGRYYFGYDLYMLTASDSENDLPIFPLLGPASRHDSHGFLYNWFSMQQFLPEANVTKLLLDSAHDAMAYYEYCHAHGIQPFIDLNGKGGRPPVYKDDFTIGDDGVPICKEGFRMRRDGTETAKGRTKFKCPKIRFAGEGCPVCTCENPCSNAKYGRTVHLVLKDNPRLFNHPPRGSKEWELQYKARTSSERCNKREKIDYKLEDGKHRSSKMWYCRLFAIMMCQHLDAWALPKSSPLKDLFRKAA